MRPAIARTTLTLLVAVATAATAHAETLWTTREGTTLLTFEQGTLDTLGISVRAFGGERDGVDLTVVSMGVSAASDLQITDEGGVLGAVSGRLVCDQGIAIVSGTDAVELDAVTIRPWVNGSFQRFVATGTARSAGALDLGSLKVGFDRVGRKVLIEGAEVSITSGLAETLGRPELAGEIIGSIYATLDLDWVGGDAPVVPSSDPTDRATSCGTSGGPDVIVGDLLDVSNYNRVGDIDAFAVGTTSCNMGDANLSWVASTNQHPVIAQNMYRLKNGRFEQVGMSWLKHGFTALTQNLCCTCSGQGGSVLGVGCSDPYCCGLNGDQGRLGPRFEVNPYTGDYLYPFTFKDQTGNSIYKRLQVKVSDLDPSLDGGGQYFVEGHYVTPDDAAAGHQANNASYRPITVSNNGSEWNIAVAGATVRESPGIRAWKDWDSTVDEVNLKVPSDGLVILAGQATNIGGGMWHYEYAMQNLYSDRCVGSFKIPVGSDSVVTNIEFHDVDYHSGEPFDGTDWPGVFQNGFILWQTTPYATNPDANALRWGTLYNFRFDCDRPPTDTTVTVGLFKPGTPDSMLANIVGPTAGPIDCNSNGIDDPDDITSGFSKDCNNNGIPDECETFAPTPLRVALVAHGLTSAVGLTAAPGDTSRLFVCEQNTGKIRIIKNGTLLATPFLNIGSLISSGGERGLLSAAFHPDYNNNGYFYVDYTNTSGDTVIARYSVTVNPDLADPTSAVILKTIPQDFSNHNGGQLQFGPDGYLYVGMGDGGSFDDPNNNAQNPQSLLGKILRLDVDAGAPYIPASNPFVGDPSTLDEIWAVGVRNPWRFSFDRDTGDLYIGDVGQNAREEIDFQPASSTGGENYGWDCEEGFICTPTNNGGYGCSCGDGAITSPILDVAHSDSGTCSITGGYVYRGCAIPDLQGTYFFSDYCGGYVRTFRYAPGDAVPPVVTDRTAELSPTEGGIDGAIVSFGEDAAGELYIVTLSGNVYKIISDAPQCGNFVVESGEECDDGNAVGGDGCSETCQLEATCGNGVVEFGEQCDPPDGGTCNASCQFASCSDPTFEDHFNTDLGWTVQNTSLTAGAWQRGDPSGDGTRGDPTDDYDGGGQCYVTQNGAGDTDVDGGPTTLISPMVDLSAGDATLQYAYWYTRDDQDGIDTLYVEVSVNGGGSWTQVAQHATSASVWRTNSVFLDNYVTPSAITQVRFRVADNPNNSVIEAGIDAVSFSLACPDCNSNGIDDELEIAAGTASDCNGNMLPDDCDLAAGTSSDCDGGPVGVAANGAVHFQNICFGCHNIDGTGGPGFPGPNIRNRPRAFIWNELQNPAKQHPGGLHPEFDQQDFADIEAYLADGGSRGRPDLIPDECQALADCDNDSITDACELEAGSQVDANYDGVPDDCSACSTTIGDGDADCDVDLYDYALLQGCMSGDGTPYPGGCACFDADTDGDVDSADLSAMQTPWTGPGATVGGCVVP
ncbi:MAG TPA: PQQ-dependent sugar dehydrogenase [Phycisphaerae bacterium]|nr:PQQ-dependent sugar dehydrogenase [Phycisphaerae bacterium]